MKAGLSRVELVECRLAGWTAREATLHDVSFVECAASYVQLDGSKLGRVRFESCVLREATFERAAFGACALVDCDLRGASLTGARLAGCDLRGSMLEGAQVGVAELRGAIVDARQAVEIARLLGMAVED
ncbi:MAG: hypothetical protein NVS3B10_24390 [Polyangiales bacterium]